MIETLSSFFTNVSPLSVVIGVLAASGVNFAVWGTLGLARAWHEKIAGHPGDIYQRRTSADTPAATLINQPERIERRDVAVVIPAHNEESTMEKTIRSLLWIVPAQHIFIGSDGSTDGTVAVVQSLDCNVYDIRPNRGKAGAIQATIAHFDLARRFKAVMIVDADVVISPDYLDRALRFFQHPDIVAVAGHVRSEWNHHHFTREMFFAAYRTRLYRLLQMFIKFGQTWFHTNVTPIVPGFASIYRTSVLPMINITAPNLVIEDFNMTFEIHHKRLGRIGYDPGAAGVTEDPSLLKDYVRQVKRWNLGFWQTVRRHGFWPSAFWASLILFLIEVALFSVFLLAVPFVFLQYSLSGFAPLTLQFGQTLAYQLSWVDILIGIFIVDYLLTVLVSIIERKWQMLVYGLGFVFLRFIDAFLFLYTWPLAWVTNSHGQWTSPTRRPNHNHPISSSQANSTPSPVPLQSQTPGSSKPGGVES